MPDISLYSPSTSMPQDFITHYNYAKCMNGMLHQIQINAPIASSVNLDLAKCKKFLKLAKLTGDGITSEFNACNSQPEYAEIVAPWVAVKCYYRLYYLECVLLHLSQGDLAVFSSGGHARARKMMTGFCSSRYISSNRQEAEKVVTVLDAQAHRIRAGSNISPTYCYTAECINSVRAKIAIYAEEHWKSNQRIRRYSTPALRAQRDQWKSSHKICLLDFFYQMRLKTNYKDADFLDVNNVPASDLVEYVRMYVSAANRYTQALSREIRRIQTVRGISLH